MMVMMLTTPILKRPKAHCNVRYKKKIYIELPRTTQSLKEDWKRRTFSGLSVGIDPKINSPLR